ncbi:endonuclease/exonuclease/phosphatase family protein [Actinomycetospora sp. TBRC 11914]|uniref:endonuclease/exonuclease/phosphatase family protein n=1 Tax=Actinomycetospora sp. TBRC 11914 TaxID=2729387 RepID=UPI00145E3876|nr:endonuclease/exonuclease/phosphatase family protein [Actinomycetospora sp. TBRC 11914]NMO90425.1 endonuclease/exonuclease/phosphatase family protein [Actinomycetospora sp. TBRC 11914]
MRATTGALVGAGAGALVLLPEVLGLDRTPPWPLVVAFRRRLAVGTGLAGLAVAARRGRGRAPALGAASVAGGALGLSLFRHRRRREPVGVGTRELTVLGANVWLGRADPAALAATIADRRPDVVVLPEAGDRFRKRLLDGLEGYRAWSCAPQRPAVEASGAPDGPCLTVLTAAALGEVEVAVASTDTRSGWVVVSGGGLGPVRVVGVHPAVLLPASTPDWVRELALLRPWLSDPARPTVVLGDLNATLEHAPLQRALGGARPVTRRAAATWPAWWRRACGVTIDHVLVAGPIGVRGVEVLDVPGSDHRGVLARLLV